MGTNIGLPGGQKPIRPLKNRDVGMEWNIIRTFFSKLLEALRLEPSASNRERVDAPGNRKSEAFTVHCEGIPIRGRVYFPTARPDRLYPVVILCHGIPGSGAERPSDDPGYEGMASEFTSLGTAAAVFNFRGCGDSGGNFAMMGWVRDLEGVLDTVINLPHIDKTRVILLGFSGGGAAATCASSENADVYGLAIVGTPAHFRLFEDKPETIIEDFRKRGIIRDPDFPPDVTAWMDEFDRIEPRRWIAQFEGRYVLIVHGDADELIPVEHAKELYAAAPAGISELVILPGGVHRLRLDPRCIALLKDWVSKILGWKGATRT
jgi:uncharacterized protein